MAVTMLLLRWRSVKAVTMTALSETCTCIAVTVSSNKTCLEQSVIEPLVRDQNRIGTLAVKTVFSEFFVGM